MLLLRQQQAQQRRHVCIRITAVAALRACAAVGKCWGGRPGCGGCCRESRGRERRPALGWSRERRRRRRRQEEWCRRLSRSTGKLRASRGCSLVQKRCSALQLGTCRRGGGGWASGGRGGGWRRLRGAAVQQQLPETTVVRSHRSAPKRPPRLCGVAQAPCGFDLGPASPWCVGRCCDTPWLGPVAEWNAAQAPSVSQPGAPPRRLSAQPCAGACRPSRHRLGHTHACFKPVSDCRHAQLGCRSAEFAVPRSRLPEEPDSSSEQTTDSPTADQASNRGRSCHRRSPPRTARRRRRRCLHEPMARGLPSLFGVLGAGQMGAGIAQVAATCGLQVRAVRRPCCVIASQRLPSAALALSTKKQAS